MIEKQWFVTYLLTPILLLVLSSLCLAETGRAIVLVDGLGLGMTKVTCDSVQGKMDRKPQVQEQWNAEGTLVNYVIGDNRPVSEGSIVGSSVVFDSKGEAAYIVGSSLSVGDQQFGRNGVFKELICRLGEPGEVISDYTDRYAGLFDSGRPFEQQLLELQLVGLSPGKILSRRLAKYPYLGLTVDLRPGSDADRIHGFFLAGQSFKLS